MTDSKGIRCDDRRDAPRYDRVVRVSYGFDGKQVPAVSLDIGPTGVFLLTQRVPSPGERVELCVRGLRIESPEIRLVAEVVRVVRRPDTPSHMPPGSALRWVRALFEGSAEVLKHELSELLGLDADVVLRSDGVAAYEFPNPMGPADMPDGTVVDTGEHEIRGTLAVAVPIRWHIGDQSGDGRLLTAQMHQVEFEVPQATLVVGTKVDLLVSPPAEASSEGIRIVVEVSAVEGDGGAKVVTGRILLVDELPGSQGFAWLIQNLSGRAPSDSSEDSDGTKAP